MSRLSLVGASVLAVWCLAARAWTAPPQAAPQPQPGAPPPAPPATAQQLPEPREGQAGKDVIWLPTPEALVERMLTMAQVGPKDVVYDLGSGDGRMVIAAAKRGAQAVGVEFDASLVQRSERRAREAGLSGKARFIQGDIFETKFQDATVVTLYLLSTLNMRLRPTLLALRPGTRVVSHAFSMDDWSPDETARAEHRTAYLWIVPAAVEGSWSIDLGGGQSVAARLTQRYQKVEGTLTLGEVEAGLREPVLRGDRLRFGFVAQDGVWYELDGRVAGDRITGSFTATGGKTGRFTATRR